MANKNSSTSKMSSPTLTKKPTHFNKHGQAQIVNISDKPVTKRTAVAKGNITMQPDTLQMIKQGNSKKGDILGVARIAAIQAAKRADELIPLCHSIPLTHITVTFEIVEQTNSVHCEITAETQAQTGVEMEALLAVQIALLTIYDMCKSVDRSMHMENIRLIHKSGGTSGEWPNPTTK